MSFRLLLLTGGADVTPTSTRGAYLPVHDATLILEISNAPALASDAGQNWLDASDWLVNKAGQLEGVVAVEQGRDSETDQFREGSLNVLLDNTDGDFDRRNTGSPFFGALRSRRQIRLLAHRGEPGAPTGPIESQFRGFVRGWPRHYGLTHQFSWIALTAFDGLRILAEAGFEDAVFTLDDSTLGRLDVSRLAGDEEPVELSGTRIEALADVAGWPADLRAIDPGIVFVGEQQANSPLDAIHQAEAAEAGYVFIDKEGNLTFLDRLAPWEDERQTTSQATFGGVAGLKLFDVDGVGPDASRIRNDVTRIGLSGLEQTAVDEDSVADYGRIPDGPETVIAVNDDDVAGIAVLRLAAQSADIERLEELVIEATVDPDTLYDELMQRRVLDRVTVELNEPNGDTYTDDWLVQKARQTISASSWRGVYRLAPTSDLTLFTLDDDDLALLDGVAVLAP